MPVAERRLEPAGIPTAVLEGGEGPPMARFRPSPRFAFGVVGFVARPSERSYERFMRQCAFDLGSLQAMMGKDWEPFADYNLELARGPKSRTAGKLLCKVGIPRIEPEELHVSPLSPA